VEDEALSGSSSDRPTGRRPAGLLGMLVLIVVVEALIATRRADLVNAWCDDWRLSAQAAVTKAKEAEILCFGDSLVKYGVFPRVIEARTGLKAYNLAVSGGNMASAYFLLRQSLESGARPKAVVVDIVPLMLLEDKIAQPLNYAELGTCRDLFDLAWTTGDGDLLGNVILGKFLPSTRWRFEIRQNIQAALEGRISSQKQGLLGFWALWNREKGAQPTPTGRLYHPQEDFLVDGVCPPQWACNPSERAYAERFLALAEAHRIQVYWLIPPMTPSVVARRAVRGTDARYDGFVRSILAKHRSTVVLDGRFSGYDDSVHHDHIHLNNQGGMILSADLAEILLDDLTSGADRPPGLRTLPELAGRTGNEPISRVARSRNSSPANGTLR
jgi:hypothetical protein